MAAQDEGDDNFARAGVFALDEAIATTPAATLAGAAVKLRRLLDPEHGIEIGPKDTDLPALRNVLAVIEREVAAKEDRR